jgi:protein SCO1/2
MTLRRPTLLVVLVALVAAITGAFVARILNPVAPPLAAGTWLPKARTLSAFELQDTAGQRFGAQSLRGQPHLLFFGFTYCPDVCPTTLATLREVYKSRIADGLPDFAVTFVSIDPERDTADNLRQYLNAFSSDFTGVRGSADALAPLLKDLGAIAVKQPLADGSYTMDHTAAVYLLDARGRYRAVFTAPITAAGLRSDLRRIQAADAL